MVNLIENGDFETGTLKFWKKQELDGTCEVVNHNRSYRAKLNPGKNNGILLFTQFKADEGPFIFSFQASAPEAQDYPPPFDYVKHPFLVYFVSGFDANGQLIRTDLGMAQLLATEKLFQYSGTMPPNTVNVEVRFSGPSDPQQTKRSLYIDNVSFVKAQLLPDRWS